MTAARRRQFWRALRVRAAAVVAAASLVGAVMIAIPASADDTAIEPPVPVVVAPGDAAIVGSPEVGGTLTIVAGAWQPETTDVTVTWFADDLEVVEAPPENADQSLTLVPAHLGARITAVLTGRADGFEPAAVTLTTGALVAPGEFSRTPQPTVSGKALVGSSLRVDAGSWTPSPTLSRQWFRNGKAIAGATGATYRLTAADRGARVSVKVTATASGYAPVSRTSASTAAVLAVFAQAPTPRIIGPRAVGATLRAIPGTWTPSARFSYQWFRNGTAIRGATGSTYVAKSADRGKTVAVRVAGSRTGYLGVARTSTKTARLRSTLSIGDPALPTVLVNKRRALSPKSYVPTGMTAPRVRGAGYVMKKDAARALEQLFAGARAAKAGEMSLAAGYRSYATQSQIFNQFVATRGRSAAETFSARPGHSEHQTGYAADVAACGPSSCGAMGAFGGTKQSAWVSANAWRYGFIVRYEKSATSVTGYTAEPWHLRFIGKTLAREYRAGGFTSLERFLGASAAPSYR